MSHILSKLLASTQFQMKCQRETLRVFSFRAGAICRCLSDEEGGGLGGGVEIVTCEMEIGIDIIIVMDV